MTGIVWAAVSTSCSACRRSSRVATPVIQNGSCLFDPRSEPKKKEGFASIYKVASQHGSTTPSAPAKEASRHFIDGAATPPNLDDAGHEHMVLQVFANAGQVLDDVDSKAAQRLRLPDA